MVKRFPELEGLRESLDAAHSRFLAELAEVPEYFEKPLIVMSFMGPESVSVGPLFEHGVPVFPSAVRAARAMRALLDYRRIRDPA